MWHRFDEPLRDAVIAALRAAAHSGRSSAEPRDLVSGLHDRAVAPDNPPANAISPAALEAFEQAYAIAARSGARTIGVEHLSIGLNLEHSPATAQPPRVPPQLPPLCPLNPQFSIDPYPLYRELRRAGPIQRDPVLSWWVVTGYREVTQVLRDRRFSSAPRSNRTKSGTMELDRLPAGRVRRDLAVMGQMITAQLAFLDPPDHTRVRGRFGQLLAGWDADTVRRRGEAIAQELIAAAASHGRMDLIKDYAYLLPLRIASDMLGFDRADEAVLLRWADVFGDTLAFNMSLEQDLAARQTLLEMRRQLPHLIRNSPLSRLGDSVDEDELFANTGFLLAAAHDTTAGTLGAGMRALLQSPDQLQRLRDEPGLLANAAEELLRCESPVQWTARRALEDLEVGGQQIARGEIALVSIGAANRDPRQFDDPDRLDIARPNADRHLAFGGGAHYCLGAPFGRIELQVGVAALVRLRNLRLDPDAQPAWRMGTALRALRSLPVLFDT